jgi:PAS domain S-box-containing protein
MPPKSTIPDGSAPAAAAPRQDIEGELRQRVARLELSLRDSETRFRRAFEDAAIGMSLGNREAFCVEANAAYCRILGRPRAEIVGHAFAEFTHPDDYATYTRQHARLIAGEVESYELEKRYLRPDGSVVVGLLTCSAVRDDSGAFLYDIGQLQDITARKTAEAALRESDARLEALLTHLPAALYRQDAPGDGSATYVSPSFATMLGLDPADFPLGFSAFFDRIHPDDRARALRDAAVSEETGAPFDLEYRLRRADGGWIWVHDRSAIERDAAGRPVAWTGVILDVTERKQLEAALREHETQLRSIVEQLPAAIYHYAAAPVSRYTFATSRFEALAGLPLGPEGMALEEYFARIHPDDIGFVRELDELVARTGQPYDARYRMCGPAGQWRWVHDRAVLERDERGAPVAWHGVLLDITAEKELEGSLDESEARFRSIFEGAGIGMALSAPDGTILVANPAMGRFLGYAPDELTGVRIDDITHPDDRPAQEALRRRLHAGEIDAYMLEKRYLRRDGSTAWGLINATPIRDDTGAPRAVIGQIQDITSRKETEAALRESEARFRALVQHDPDVTVVVNAERQIVYVSPAAMAALGAPPEELLGPEEEAYRYVHPHDLDAAVALFDRVADVPGASASVETRLWHHQRGWLWFQISVANLLADPGVRGYLFKLRDVTERKQSELATQTALETQQMAIAELERLNQSKTRFLATISHEFRTPLTAIIGFSELLAAGADPAAAEDAAIIHREASRLNRMVDDVLLIERLEAGRLVLARQPLDLNAVVRDVVEACRPLAAGHRFTLALDPALRPVSGDPDRLAQALTNLVGNAIKYSAPGSTVTLTSRNDGDEVEIAVRDEGVGIAPEDVERIFDRFERVERGIAGRVAGTGLGLAIAQEIAHLHHGRLAVESEPGFGSTFFLRLPALAPTAEFN